MGGKQSFWFLFSLVLDLLGLVKSCEDKFYASSIRVPYTPSQSSLLEDSGGTVLGFSGHNKEGHMKVLPHPESGSMAALCEEGLGGTQK